MIGLDTNILIRFLTQDDPAASAVATALFERRLNSREPGFLSVPSIVEMVWVLSSVYALSKAEIATIIERLLENDALVVEQRQSVFLATVAMEEGADFADALIGGLNLAAGCAHTVTFDRKAARLPGFKLLS